MQRRGMQAMLTAVKPCHSCSPETFGTPEDGYWVQAYYGKLDAETVTRYGLQRAMSGYQATNRSGDVLMIFKQARHTPPPWTLGL